MFCCYPTDSIYALSPRKMALQRRWRKGLGCVWYSFYLLVYGISQRVLPTSGTQYGLWMSGSIWLMSDSKNQNWWSICVAVVQPMQYREASVGDLRPMGYVLLIVFPLVVMDLCWFQTFLSITLMTNGQLFYWPGWVIGSCSSVKFWAGTC